MQEKPVKRLIPMHPTSGYLYVLCHPLWPPRCLKFGITTNLRSRFANYNSHGGPVDIIPRHVLVCVNAKQVEDQLKEQTKAFRYPRRKEYVCMDESDLMRCIYSLVTIDTTLSDACKWAVYATASPPLSLPPGSSLTTATTPVKLVPLAVQCDGQFFCHRKPSERDDDDEDENNVDSGQLCCQRRLLAETAVPSTMEPETVYNRDLGLTFVLSLPTNRTMDTITKSAFIQMDTHGAPPLDDLPCAPEPTRAVHAAREKKKLKAVGSKLERAAEDNTDNSSSSSSDGHSSAATTAIQTSSQKKRKRTAVAVPSVLVKPVLGVYWDKSYGRWVGTRASDNVRKSFSEAKYGARAHEMAIKWRLGMPS